MGMEDYGVVLRPKPKKSLFPDDSSFSAIITNGAVSHARKLTLAEIEGAMEALGFVRLAPTVHAGPARLAAPPKHEVRYASRQRFASSIEGDDSESGEYILEALVRWHSEGIEELFDSLSVRFAVCQPEEATWHFLKIVKRLCDTLPLVIAHEDKTYSPEVFWAFRLHASEQIRSKRNQWRNLFEGDTEERAMSVDEAWSHFLQKHRQLTDLSETTVARCDSETGLLATFNPEETVAPPVNKRSALKRGIQA
jgi:hypothetical protein